MFNMIRKLLPLLPALVLLLPVTVAASPRFPDVPTDHWAYTAINNVSDRGFMVANTLGEFGPGDFLSKFDTARILASVVGFRPIGQSPEEAAFINAAYANNSALLQEMANTYTRWNSTVNREIAYLLELGILTSADLRNFVIINNEQEQLRALSRQEAARFLVRVAGLSDDAARGSYAQLFNDDGAIDPALRHYVYFLRAAGVIGGDDLGNFRPNGAVDRATFAVLLDRTMAVSVAQGPQIEMVSGSIAVIFNQLRAIQIQTDTGSPVRRVSPAASITINGEPGSFEALSAGMSLTGTLENNVLIALTTTGEREAPLPAPEPPTPAPPAYEPPAAIYNTLRGVLTDFDDNTITIEINFISPTNIIYTEELTFVLNQTAVFLGNDSVSISALEAGDIVTLTISGDRVREIRAVERDRTFIGVLRDRIINPDFDTITYAIYYNGQVSQFNIPAFAVLEREGRGVVLPHQIRIGDRVEVVANQVDIIRLFAFSQISSVDGTVIETSFRQHLSSVTVNVNGVNQTYYITGTIDGMHDLVVGQRVRLRLDSMEIEGFTLLY